MIKKASKKTLIILGIETSCDETSVALLKFVKSLKSVKSVKSIKLLQHYIATQIPIHARYGGVVPEVAARMHVAEIVSLLDKTLFWSRVARRELARNTSLRSTCMAGGSRVASGKMPNTKYKKSEVDFDAIAVTQGPGLATALRVGIEAGKTLAWVYDKPLIAVNHLEGHLASAWLVPQNRRRWKFPILFLLVSGGHTELVLMKNFGKYKVLGRTRDDAAGEAFDKTAKLLDLPYPGGPHLSKLAETGDNKAFDLPRPMIHDKSLDFSFSGLKTAVRQIIEGTTYNASSPLRDHATYIQMEAGKRVTHNASTRLISQMSKKEKADLCASIQTAIVDVLVSKTLKAIKISKPKAFAVVGGVSANKHLQESLKQALKKEDPAVAYLLPAKGLHTDNGAMIAAAGLWNLMTGKKPTSLEKLDAEPELDF